MGKPPRFSVVTSSYNQGRYIAQAIDSVLDQGYPDFEHIVVDGMSTDATPEVLSRYSHLRVLREPDSGQAEAINKGFRLATGDIHCFLNSDDTLLPGAFHRVAQEIDPERGRHIVVGRCRYIDEWDRPTGLEHPCAFRDHRRVLEIWKGNSLPQPSTFWSAEVGRRCGPLDEREDLVLDYDLFCRFSRHFPFHVLDQFLATYRLHPGSKTCRHPPRQSYLAALRVSRRYWGSPRQLLFWQLLGSFVMTRWSRAASLLTATGARLRGQGRWLPANSCECAGALLNPVAAFRRIQRRRASAQVDPATPLEPLRASVANEEFTDTLAWRSFVDIHKDGCVGPSVRLPLHIRAGDVQLKLDGSAAFPNAPRKLHIVFALDGRPLRCVVVDSRGDFSIALDIGRPASGIHELEMHASPVLIPHHYLGDRDVRPVTFRMRGLRLLPEASEANGASARVGYALRGA